MLRLVLILLVLFSPVWGELNRKEDNIKYDSEYKKLFTSRMRSASVKRREKFEEMESLLPTDGLSNTNSQHDLTRNDMNECSEILKQCMKKKEILDMHVLEMYDYIIELQSIILQIEYLRTFSETSVDSEELYDEHALQAERDLFEYNKRHYLKSPEYYSRFFKDGFMEFDDVWKYVLNEAHIQRKTCALIDLCTTKYNYNLKKIRSGRGLVKILNSAMETLQKSKFATHKGSLVRKILEEWADFNTRKAPHENQETFKTLNFQDLDISDIISSREKLKQSKIPSIALHYYPEKKDNLLDTLFTNYTNQILPKIIPPIMGEIGKVEVEEVADYPMEDLLEHAAKVSAYIPDHMKAFEVLYDRKFTINTSDYKVKVHFFKEAIVERQYVQTETKNEVIFTANTLVWDNDLEVIDAGWEWGKTPSFSFINLDIEGIPYFRFIFACGNKTEIEGLRMVRRDPMSFEATLSTPAACSA